MDSILESADPEKDEIFGSSQPEQNPLFGDIFADTKDITNAKSYLGSNAYDNYCQEFVEKVTKGKTGIYPSAITAWQKQQNKAKQGLNGVQPGDVLYFSPNQSNHNDGHSGIYLGSNQMISATSNGVGIANLNDWTKSTGQQVLGFIPSSNN